MDRKKWAGMRRKQGVKHRESSEGSEHYLEPEITIPARTRRLHRCGGDYGQQQNYTGLEEQWQADQHGSDEAAPGRIPFPDDTQSRSRQGPGGARMLQDRAQNEAECNHGARAAQHVGKTRLDGDNRIVRAQPRKASQSEGPAEQSEEGVHPDFDDQPNGKPNASNRRSQNLQFCHRRIKSFAMMARN
jgi:hypothetical protein